MRDLFLFLFPSTKNHSFKQSYLRSEYSGRLRMHRKPVQCSYLMENREKICASSEKQHMVVYLKYFHSNNRKLTIYFIWYLCRGKDLSASREGNLCLVPMFLRMAVHIISAYMKISAMVLFSELWLCTCFEEHWQNL